MSNYNLQVRGTYMNITRDEANGAFAVDHGAVFNNGVLAPLLGSPLVFTVPGATMFANANCLTPDGSAYLRKIDTNLRTMFRLDTLYANRESFFTETEFEYSALPTGIETFWDHGAASVDNGGTTLRLIDEGRAGFRHLPGGGAGAEETFYSKDPLPFNTKIKLATLVDGYNRNRFAAPYVSSFVNGRLELTKHLTPPFAFGSTATNFGFILFGQSGSLNPLNRAGNKGSGMKVHRMFFMRIVGEMTHHILPTTLAMQLDRTMIPAPLLVGP